MHRSLTDISLLAISPISLYNGFNTSIHRVNALRSLGCSVSVIDSSLDHLGPRQKLFRRITNRLFAYGLPIPLIGGSTLRNSLIKEVKQNHWDVIWLEKALDIDKKTLSFIKKHSNDCLIIGFSPDDMNARHNQSQQFLDSMKLYNAFITTKSYNVPELKRLGCSRPLYMPNGYDPKAFMPIKPNADECISLGGDVGFIGTYETDRYRMMAYLAKCGLSVRVWGGGWNIVRNKHLMLTLESQPLLGDKYSKACNAFKINLNFLRKMNRDLQTTRSIEIPACGGFMLAERTDEHQELFKEGIEADYFSSKEELFDKCKYYLTHDSIRIRIAQAGYHRCIQSGYSNVERLKTALCLLLDPHDQ